MNLEAWVRHSSRPDIVYGLTGAVARDFARLESRVEYALAIVRNVPGHFGKWIRQRLVTRFSDSAGTRLVLWPGTRFRFIHNISFGDNVAISYDCLFQAAAGITIGSNTLFGPGVKVWTMNHIFKDHERCINTQGYEGRPVVIGDDCWIASNVFVKPGTVLPNGTVVLPNTTIGKMRIPEYSVVGGSPAKVMGPRSKVGAMMGWGATVRS
ncbi:MAG: acyltransferase [bacterium]